MAQWYTYTHTHTNVGVSSGPCQVSHLGFSIIWAAPLYYIHLQLAMNQIHYTYECSYTYAHTYNPADNHVDALHYVGLCGCKLFCMKGCYLAERWRNCWLGGWGCWAGEGRGGCRRRIGITRYIKAEQVFFFPFPLPVLNLSLHHVSRAIIYYAIICFWWLILI